MKKQLYLILALGIVGCTSAGANETLSASDIVFDTSQSALRGGSVQEALDETAPDLVREIVGAWELTEIFLSARVGEDLVRDNGSVTFNEDGTFEVTGIVYEDPVNSIWGSIQVKFDSIVSDLSATYEIIDNMYLILKANGKNSQGETVGLNRSFVIFKTSADKICLESAILTRAGL